MQTILIDDFKHRGVSADSVFLCFTVYALNACFVWFVLDNYA